MNGKGRMNWGIDWLLTFHHQTMKVNWINEVSCANAATQRNLFNHLKQRQARKQSIMERIKFNEWNGWCGSSWPATAGRKQLISFILFIPLQPLVSIYFNSSFAAGVSCAHSVIKIKFRWIIAAGSNQSIPQSISPSPWIAFTSEIDGNGMIALIN